MDFYERLVKGTIKPYELEDAILKEKYNNDGKKWADSNREASKIRLRFVEENLGKKLPNIDRCFVSLADAKKNTTGIEQQIGGASLPLGLGGPLKINGENFNGEAYLPVATNEAALVAGLNKGCKTFNQSGGIRTVITRDHMTRAPMVELPDLKRAKDLAQKVKEKGGLYEKMKDASEKDSKVSKLLDIQPFQMGRRVSLRFYFQTGDSMGMNSATKYSANAIKALREDYPDIRLVSLTANMCSDKKATHINVLLGRGKSVETEVLVPGKVVRENYGVEPKNVVKLNFLKNFQGSSFAGTLTGFNANVANTIASIFIAAGQDAAQIVESSSCFTNMELVGDDILFSASFPCIEVATVGGGTGTGTARECLEIMGCWGPGEPAGSNSRKLAEIIAGAASAQDFNLIATQTNEYELADSHIKMARGKR